MFSLRSMFSFFIFKDLAGAFSNFPASEVLNYVVGWALWHRRSCEPIALLVADVLWRRSLFRCSDRFKWQRFSSISGSLPLLAPSAQQRSRGFNPAGYQSSDGFITAAAFITVTVLCASSLRTACVGHWVDEERFQYCSRTPDIHTHQEWTLLGASKYLTVVSKCTNFKNSKPLFIEIITHILFSLIF